MGGAAPHPVARLWEVSGGLVGDPGAVEAIRAAAVAHLAESPGYHGRIVLVDRERKVVLGLSVWEDEEAEATSWVSFAPIAEEMARSAAATAGEPRLYEVVYGGFRGVYTRTPTAAETGPMRARIARFEGGEVASPWLTDSLRKHTATSVARTPGCVAALLMRDVDRRLVLAATIWADDRSRERSIGLASNAVTAVSSAGGATVDVTTYDVLYYEQPD